MKLMFLYLQHDLTYRFFTCLSHELVHIHLDSMNHCAIERPYIPIHEARAQNSHIYDQLIYDKNELRIK